MVERFHAKGLLFIRQLIKMAKQIYELYLAVCRLCSNKAVLTDDFTQRCIGVLSFNQVCVILIAVLTLSIGWQSQSSPGTIVYYSYSLHSAFEL